MARPGARSTLGSHREAGLQGLLHGGHSMVYGAGGSHKGAVLSYQGGDLYQGHTSDRLTPSPGQP